MTNVSRQEKISSFLETHHQCPIATGAGVGHTNICRFLVAQNPCQKAHFWKQYVIQVSQSITDLLHQWGSGDPEALNQLMPVVRTRLYELAEYHLQHESIRPLQPTELLNEVYLRLTQYKHPNFRDRNHFFGAAASLIRRILVDMSRRMRSAKRDLSLVVEDFPLESATVNTNLNIEALDAALDKMARLDARQARIVELRYFAGFSIMETAQLLEISPATVKRDWDVAKAWLKRELLK